MGSKICLVPHLSGIGGMVSFQGKLAAGLEARGIEVCYDLNDLPYDSVLVIGGLRQLHRLWRIKRQGIRIVQRLDGMNWVHRVLDTGWRHWLRSTYGNLILAYIRATLAEKIIYQSRFSKEWWEEKRGATRIPSEVIHNGVNLAKFSPGDENNADKGVIRLLIVEGSLLGGYEFGLQNAVKIAADVAHSHTESSAMELIVVGRVLKDTMRHWDRWIEKNHKKGSFFINWRGVVPHKQIIEVYRDAHLLFSADINAACPNSVIESMACGTPVVAFDTGALNELLKDRGGLVAPYGADPWQLEKPDYLSLSEAASKILDNLEKYRKSARKRAEEAFNVEDMVDRYLEVLLG